MPIPYLLLDAHIIFNHNEGTSVTFIKVNGATFRMYWAGKLATDEVVSQIDQSRNIISRITNVYYSNSLSEIASLVLSIVQIQLATSAWSVWSSFVTFLTQIWFRVKYALRHNPCRCYWPMRKAFPPFAISKIFFNHIASWIHQTLFELSCSRSAYMFQTPIVKIFIIKETHFFQKQNKN